MLKIKRVYEEYDTNDGFRILVDRLWPRGVSKVEAHIDLWFKDITPSPELRSWFNHDPKKWKEFQKRYKEELQENQDAVKEVRKLLDTYDHVTFVYAAKDEQHNHALVLYEYFR